MKNIILRTCEYLFNPAPNDAHTSSSGLWSFVEKENILTIKEGDGALVRDAA